MKLVSGALSAVGLISKPKIKVPKATPIATRDDARDRVELSRDTLRRRGGAADILFGNGGLEPGAPASLGSPGTPQ